jgi:hypothetical protein
MALLKLRARQISDANISEQPSPELAGLREFEGGTSENPSMITTQEQGHAKRKHDYDATR